MYKRKKLKNKKFKRGGSTGFEGSPELGGRGTTATYGFDQSGPKMDKEKNEYMFSL